MVCMSEQIRYGVIGTEMMGVEHIENILAIDGAVVTAIADAVVIVTPNNTHADVMDDVLDAGVHVLCEKPLCTIVDDTQRVIAKAEATGGSEGDRKVWVGLEYRYMPAVAELIADVHAGVVGTPKMVAIREHRFPFLTKVGNWNRFSENTGGTLVEKCCHFFNLMNLLLDERPDRIMASGAQDVNHCACSPRQPATRRRCR